jgi:hypothetical protein
MSWKSDTVSDQEVANLVGRSRAFSGKPSERPLL